MDPATDLPPRRVVLVLAVVAGLAVVLLSPAFGRAPVTANYRPDVPPDALTNGCYPLPGGVVPAFAYVVRRDGDTLDSRGLRRRLVLHVDRVGAAEATSTLEEQLAAAGVADDVGIDGRDLDVPAGSVVRAELVLDLPVIGPQSDAPVCDDTLSTKRFTPDETDLS